MDEAAEVYDDVKTLLSFHKHSEASKQKRTSEAAINRCRRHGRKLGSVNVQKDVGFQDRCLNNAQALFDHADELEENQRVFESLRYDFKDYLVNAPLSYANVVERENLGPNEHEHVAQFHRGGLAHWKNHTKEECVYRRV